MSDLLREYDALRAVTPARLTLLSAGVSPTTRERLALAADHALARDAVRAALDPASLTQELARYTIQSTLIRSQAETLQDHLLRPDFGRQVHPDDAAALHETADTAIVIADGLSAGAIHRYAPRLLKALGDVDRAILVRHGRVAIGDEIGQRLSASVAIVLIGERPGLSAPESLGIYVTYAPHVGRTDAERNCISNVRDGGTPPEAAAVKLKELLNTIKHHRLGGVGVLPALP